MNREELYSAFVDFIHKYYTSNQITHQTCLGKGGLELDSLDTASLLVEFEEKYNGSFEEDLVDNYICYTIDEVLDRFIQKNS